MQGGIKEEAGKQAPAGIKQNDNQTDGSLDEVN